MITFLQNKETQIDVMQRAALAAKIMVDGLPCQEGTRVIQDVLRDILADDMHLDPQSVLDIAVNVRGRDDLSIGSAVITFNSPDAVERIMNHREFQDPLHPNPNRVRVPTFRFGGNFFRALIMSRCREVAPPVRSIFLISACICESMCSRETIYLLLFFIYVHDPFYFYVCFSYLLFFDS